MKRNYAMSKFVMRVASALFAALVIGFVGVPLASAATPVTGADVQPADVAVQAPAWSYHIEASCGGWEGAIRQGANYWGGASEGGGTPVQCQNSAITDCGFFADSIEITDVHGNLIVVGCNYGSGQLIKLYPGAVNDAALLAAHEFGHNWYGHSFNGCASWASPNDVMATTMC
jgi:hypothetical protein